jgi:eukaryotic-like serine/threonine-protein kinase
MDAERWRRIEDLFMDAVEMSPTEASRYLDRVCNGDTELRREVDLLLESDRQAQGGLQSAVQQAAVSLRQQIDNSSPVYVGRRIGPYEIVREIGRGGMGAVYHAVRVDEQYLRSVAIKFIAHGMSSDEARARFLRERQILATLQHPNIAALLDGGTTEDGLPYIVMEFIEGEPLTAYCRRKELSIPERLELFVSLCSAVQHAHQALVIHRDIKPSNVLVTPDGVPKLLDFGIAKLMAGDFIPGDRRDTRTEFRRLTPQYASPEQIRGETLTTATDIYSLGVLLYEVLTFESPYRITGRTSQEIERAVCDSEPLRLTAAARQDPKLRRMLAGDLENIVLMALRKEPERRYPTVQQFADDISRYLKGLPVSAREETLFYLASKLIRRNRLAAAAFALLALSLVFGWMATIRESRRTQARFNELRKIANVMLYDVNRQIAPLPGATPARELLVATALEYLNSLSRDASNDLSLQWEISQAYEQIGDVQGDPDGPNLGKSRDALESYSKARSMVEAIAAKRSDYEVLSCLTWLNYKYGDLEQRNLSAAQAVATYEKGLRVALRVQSEIKDPRADDLVRNGYQKISTAQMRLGATGKALESARLALEAAKRSAARPTAGPGAKGNLARAQLLFGNVLWIRGDLQGASREYAAAVTRMEELRELLPENPSVLAELEEAYRRSGDLQGNPSYFHFGNTELAREFHQKALVIAQKLAERDPRNAQAQSRLSVAYRRIGAVSRDSNPAAAMKYYQQSIEIAAKLSAQAPGDFTYLRNLANSRLGLSFALRNLRKMDAALDELQATIAIQKEMLRRSPERVVFREDLFDTLLALSDVHVAKNDLESGKQYLDEALSTARYLVEHNTDSLYPERCLALVLGRQGDYYARLARQASAQERPHLAYQALTWYDKAHAIWMKWRTSNTATEFAVNREREILEARAKLGI